MPKALPVGLPDDGHPSKHVDSYLLTVSGSSIRKTTVSRKKKISCLVWDLNEVKNSFFSQYYCTLLSSKTFVMSSVAMLEAGSDKSNLPQFIQIRLLLVVFIVLLYVIQLNFLL